MQRIFRLLSVAVLLAREGDAAPRVLEDQAAVRIIQGRGPPPPPNSDARTQHVHGRSRPETHYNGTAAAGTVVTTSNTVVSRPFNTSTTLTPSSVCPVSIATSTTTIDITFYVTATTSYGGNTTTSIGTGTAQPPLPSSSGLQSNSTTSRATQSTSTSAHIPTGFTRPVNSSCISATASPSGSHALCPNSTISTRCPHTNTTMIGSTKHAVSESATSVSSNGYNTSPSASWNSTITTDPPSHTTKPCDDDTSPISRSKSTMTASSTLQNSTSSCSQTSSTSSAQETTAASTVPATTPTTICTSSLTQNNTAILSSPVSSLTYTTPNGHTGATPSQSVISSTLSAHVTSSSATRSHVPSESCVIDSSMIPITSAPLTSIPSSTLVPTKTVCQDDAPSGKPKPGNHHCGVHGLPVGNYFLARFVENAVGVPVTLEGCYQFCNSVLSATAGCKSYRFYPERGLNVPRCDLYGGNVAYALDSINNDHPDIWFDLTCGSPSDPRWAHLPGMIRLQELALLG